MLANATSGEARRGRRAAKMPSGSPMATATSVEPATSSTCCATSAASSSRCAIQKAISAIHGQSVCSATGRNAHRRARTHAADRRDRAIVRAVRLAGDQRALVEDADASAKREGLAHIVRHDDDGLAQRGLDAAELAVQLGARQRIERAERLVHQQDRWIDGERPRHADALALAARQLVGPAARESRRGRPTSSSSSRHAARDRGARPAIEPGHDADVVRDGHVRKQPDILQDVAHAPPQRDRLPFARVAALDEHGAGSSGRSSRLTSFRSVVFPAPLRPTSASTSPAASASVEIVEHTTAARAGEGT